MHRLPGTLSLVLLTAVINAIAVLEKDDCLGIYVTIWGNEEPPSETYVLSSKTYTLAAQRTPSWGSSENDTDWHHQSPSPNVWDPKTLDLPPGMTSFPCVFPPIPDSTIPINPATMQPPLPQKTTIRTTQMLPPHVPSPILTSQAPHVVPFTTVPGIYLVTTNIVDILATPSPGLAPTSPHQLEMSTLQNPAITPLAPEISTLIIADLPSSSLEALLPPDVSTLAIIVPPPSSVQALLPPAISTLAEVDPPSSSSQDPSPPVISTLAEVDPPSSSIQDPSSPVISTLAEVNFPSSSIQDPSPPTIIPSQEPPLLSITSVAPFDTIPSSLLPVPASSTVEAQMEVISSILPLLSPPTTSTLAMVGSPPSSLQVPLMMSETIISQDPGLLLSTLVPLLQAMSSSLLPVPEFSSNTPEIQITSQMQATLPVLSVPFTSSPVLAPVSSAIEAEMQVTSSVAILPSPFTSSPLLASSQIQAQLQLSSTLLAPPNSVLSSSSPTSTTAVVPAGFCSEANPCQDGLCCSQYGFCGSTIDFCGGGCQPNAGVCTTLPQSSTLLEPIQIISSSQDTVDYILTSTSPFLSAASPISPFLSSNLPFLSSSPALLWTTETTIAPDDMVSTSYPTVPSPSPSALPAPTYQFPDCGPTILSSALTWDKLYMGFGYTENPTNPGNPSNTPPVNSNSSSFSIEFSQQYACYVVTQCILFAHANLLVSIDVHLIHTVGDAAYWQCVGYPNDVGSGNYFTVANPDVLVAYGYDLGTA